MRKLEANYEALQDMFPTPMLPFGHLLDRFFPEVDVREEAKAADSRIKLGEATDSAEASSDRPNEPAIFLTPDAEEGREPWQTTIINGVYTALSKRLGDRKKVGANQNSYFGRDYVIKFVEAEDGEEIVSALDSMSRLINGAPLSQEKRREYEDVMDRGLDLNTVKVRLQGEVFDLLEAALRR